MSGDEWDYRCGRLGPTCEVSDWLQVHRSHGEVLRTYPKEQPSSYRIAILECPCGARLVTDEEP